MNSKESFLEYPAKKVKKKQTDEPVCEEASEQESGIPVKEHTRTRKKKAKERLQHRSPTCGFI